MNMALQTQDQTFTKSVALSSLNISGELTLRKQKAWHILLYCVREQFFLFTNFDPSNAHEITKEDVQRAPMVFKIKDDLIMESMGYQKGKGFYSYSTIVKIYRDLAKEIIGVDAFGFATAAGDEIGGFSSYIAQCTHENGYFQFWIPPMTVYFIVNPSISFKSPVNWTALTNKYSPLIYDMCLYFYEHRSSRDLEGARYTDYISLEDFRRVTGTAGSSYNDYNKLKSRIINKALANINEKSDSLALNITLEEAAIDSEKKVGRKRITHIRFKIRENLQYVLQKSPAQKKLTKRFITDNLEPLGVPRQSVDAVMRSASDERDPDMEYLKWCIKKGQALRVLTKYKPSSADDNDDCKKQFNFGGFFHKHIVKERKEDWFAIQQMIHAYINAHSICDMSGTDRYAYLIRKQCMRIIAVNYLSQQTDVAFSYTKDRFISFLDEQLPGHRANLGESPSLHDLAETGDSSAMLFLEEEKKLFTPDDFAEVLAELPPSSL